ncbi:MAG: efflux transporter outer membrane subunit [Xanthomonadaceae bacterium]|nr:efflux transporter outer membrane subunit [Xanthomonadaceae bacterium]
MQQAVVARAPFRISRRAPCAGHRLGRALGVSAGLALGLLAGCSVAPPLPQPRIALPEHFVQAPALGPRPDLAHWWRGFHDPALDALVTRALRENLDLQAAGERLAAARALTPTVTAKYLPQLSLYTNQQPTPGSTASYFQLGFDAVWQLGVFGRAESERRVITGNSGLAAADLAAARAALVAEVVRNYLALRAAQAQAALEAELVATAQRRVALTRVRITQHLAAPETGDAAQAALDAARAEAAAAPAAIAVARQQLAVLLGEVEPGSMLTAVAPLPAPPAATAVLPPADLLRTRPDIQRAEAAVLRAAGELGIARADLYPRLALGWTMTASARTAGGEIGRLRGIPSFGPIINMPLFDWGLRQAQVRANDHALRAAVLGYRQTVLTAVGETEQALAQLAAARERATQSAAAAAALARAAQAAATRARLGLADGLEGDSARTAALRAALVAIQAREAAGVAWRARYKAQGGAVPVTAPPTAASAGAAR